ncbi:MAG: c-type cytochrome [Bacteroidetes bacterium]|nr:c-type cytochrome [Bacteroidota bacterium]
MNRIILIIVGLITVSLLWLSLNYLDSRDGNVTQNQNTDTAYWYAPHVSALDSNLNKQLILKGRDIIMHTSAYFGPNGSISQTTNGLNCQNCHLEAGTVMWGNNYSAVASTYPKKRARSGQMEDIPKRINDCFERSLNGKTLNPDSDEMQAIVANMNWIGQGIPKGKKPTGAGIKKPEFLERAADPIHGEQVYSEKCMSCHMADGQGVLKADNKEYQYPPLWGEHSYNTGAGLYRMSNFAGYVKANMPFGTSFAFPVLSDEEAWDVAAYVNSRPRPEKDLSNDWPDISKKPIDHPFGPYADPFPESQHKYGPYKPIDDWKKSHNNQTALK